MEKILGLDLGTNSIGWAVRETNPELENQIIHKGVMTFDKGVAEDKSGEHPMVQKRTESRGKRRNYQAEKYRKWELLECLIKNNMCPLSIDELNEWRHYKKGTGRKYPENKKFIEWLRFDFDGDAKPDFERLGYSKHESYYLFRVLIIDESKKEIFRKEPHIIGRVLYQLVQRRGYNDGQNIDETEKDELSKTIMKGGGEAGAMGVNDILSYLNKHKTLGAALYHLQKEQNTRIRKRYNLRSHYEAEIKEICRVHDLAHLYKDFWGAIIWQRPLRSQKGLVGICTFEHNKRRCPISHPLYEEFRTWVFINNLKIKPIIQNDLQKNTISLGEALHKIVYNEFFKAAPDFKLSTIRNELKKVGFEITAKFPEDTKVISFSFLNKMKELFGKNWQEITGWYDLMKGISKIQPYNIEDLWHLHFVKNDNKKTGETSFDFLKRFAIEKIELTPEKAENFAKIRLQQGYATLSIYAIKKILPYLQQGHIYSEAVYLANLHKVLGKETLEEGDIENFSGIIKEIIKKDRQENRKIGIINSLIASYFEDKENFEANKISLIEKQIIESYGQATWNRISVETAINIEDEIIQSINRFLASTKQKPENHYLKTGRLHDKIFKTFMDDYGLPPQNIKYLWHPSEQENYEEAKYYQEVKLNDKTIFIEESKVDTFLANNSFSDKGGFYGKLLGSPMPISKGFKNPMALKTMYKLKKLVNYLISTGKIDKETRVVIEIARELNDANKRKAIERWQREREKQNEEIKKKIDEINKECNTDFNREDKNLIDKIRLWEEQNRICIYTGKTINCCDLLNGIKYDFEHSIPASMSFDNELKNLTIADNYYNREIKKKRLPSECPNYDREFVHEGITYPPILGSMEMLFGKMTEKEKRIKGKVLKIRSFEKIDKLEELYAEWKAKKSDDKQIKDNIIIRRHTIKMELDYWRRKLQSFTATEYKSGWRNSQLRDTQTITKYALPYLKTVFNKVEVQKGNITADFRKIYKIQYRLEKKERTKHSHHAIDAAVLTLIPPAAIRDKILQRYNEANENKQGYHENPRYWKNFRQEFITGIEDDVLINYQAQHRTLTATYKTVRKRGRVQYVKEKLENGKWQYKLDNDGKKIPIIADGNSIRGQLHKESYFGAIQNKDELSLVERYPIASFTSLNDCKNIVDIAVRNIVKETLEKRMLEGVSFDKAKLQPIFFPTSKTVIKKVRCKVAAGRGYLTPEKALEVQKHTFLSKHTYKHHVYAQNDQNTFCLYYELKDGKGTLRAFRIVGLFELSKLGINTPNQLLNDSYYNNIESGKGKNKKTLPLTMILKVGQKTIFYKDDIEELKELTQKELLQRVFRIYKFNEMGSPFIYLQNHLEARTNEKVGNGDTSFKPREYQARLTLVANSFICAIEGKDFEVNPDGEIKWKF